VKFLSLASTSFEGLPRLHHMLKTSRTGVVNLQLMSCMQLFAWFHAALT